MIKSKLHLKSIPLFHRVNRPSLQDCQLQQLRACVLTHAQHRVQQIWQLAHLHATTPGGLPATGCGHLCAQIALAPSFTQWRG